MERIENIAAATASDVQNFKTNIRIKKSTTLRHTSHQTPKYSSNFSYSLPKKLKICIKAPNFHLSQLRRHITPVHLVLFSGLLLALAGEPLARALALPPAHSPQHPHRGRLVDRAD